MSFYLLAIKTIIIIVIIIIIIIIIIISCHKPRSKWKSDFCRSHYKRIHFSELNVTPS